MKNLHTTNFYTKNQKSHQISLKTGLALATFAATISAGGLAAFSTAPSAHAESTTVNASTTILESCTIEATDNDHTGTIVAGNMEQIGGDTVFRINCNDPNGYIVYAVGNSGDTEGNTSLIATESGSDIITGTATSGDVSNWQFKLTNATENLTILSNFDSGSAVPTNRTAVIKREAGTTSPTVDSFNASYAAYIAKTQLVDTYTGKVKYILFHPSSTTVTYYNISYDTGGGSPEIAPQSGNTIEPTITLSGTAPTKSGYTFQGWCTTQPSGNNTTSPSCSGQTYQPNNSYTLSNGADVTFHAIWKQNLPQPCSSGTVRLADGKDWCRTDASTSATWEQAKSICNQGNYHLPTLEEFNALIRAYFPSTSASGTGYHYSVSTSTFASAWGAGDGRWWSSTEHDSTYACGLYLHSSSIGSGNLDPKAFYDRVRCVSS